MAGDRLAFGEVHFHLYDLAFGDGLPHQVFADAGIPFHGIGVRVVGRLPVAILLELLALLVGFLPVLHVLLARRRRKFLFDSRSAILHRCGSLSLLRAGGSGGGWIRARLRNGVQRRHSQGRQQRYKQRKREHRGPAVRTWAALRPALGVWKWWGEVIQLCKMLFYRET